MKDFFYTPDDDVKVHEEGAIRLICKPFQSHESGLPEWIKNSADAYAREDALSKNRIILVVFDNSHSKTKPSISCIDFVGMTSQNIENHFRQWADPDAASRGTQSDFVQGGHGNGGKCYMTQMFLDHSYILTVLNGRGNKYGVGSDSIKFGYIPNRNLGRDFIVNNIEKELENVLKPLRITWNSLPAPILEALDLADGFSFITGIHPKGYKNKINSTHLIRNLQEHPQMISNLEYCKVYVFANGKIQNYGLPLSLPDIPPMKIAKEPRVIQIPPTLKDPDTGEKIIIEINEDKDDGKLILYTSDKSMRYSRKGRHTIIYRTNSGFIGFKSVLEFDIQSSYRDRIYGDCKLNALESFKQNDRAHLARGPLTRAVEKFISQEIQKYASEFESIDRRRVKLPFLVPSESGHI
ncbi:MAG: hypothetical protein FVQ83_16130 [Chloroflexi bacterium]|nr:hypothetical protein [Chloroflexota bacterium]